MLQFVLQFITNQFEQLQNTNNRNPHFKHYIIF